MSISAKDLLDFDIPGGTVNDAGVSTNIDVAVQYLASWLRGNGAAAIYNLMEDAATAEISRSQIWQWVHHGVTTVEGNTVTGEFVERLAAAEAARLREEYGDEVYTSARFPEAQQLFEAVALADEFPDFLTLPAYEILEPEEATP